MIAETILDADGCDADLPDAGTLDVLNCGAGHLEIKFDRKDKSDVARARRIIADMLARGYTILVEDKGKLHRVESFDAKTDSYVVRLPRGRLKGEGAGKVKARKIKLPLRRTKATGIAPTAGG